MSVVSKCGLGYVVKDEEGREIGGMLGGMVYKGKGVESVEVD